MNLREILLQTRKNCIGENTYFWAVLLIQMWGSFGQRFWPFRSHRRKHGKCLQNRQWRPMKHHYGDCWQVRSLVWNVPAHFEDLNMQQISSTHCFVCSVIFGC